MHVMYMISSTRRWCNIDSVTLCTGTSDEHISVVEGLKQLQPDGAVLVTTPQVSWRIAAIKCCHMICIQAVALADVRRELAFCRKTGLRVLGVVENMSGYSCPHCSVRNNRYFTTLLYSQLLRNVLIYSQVAEDKLWPQNSKYHSWVSVLLVQWTYAISCL